MSSLCWESPDGKIKKNVLSIGAMKYKPTEGSKCKLQFTDSSENLSHFSTLTIGDVAENLGRLLELCVTTMFEKEKSKFTVNLNDRVLTFTLEMLEMEFAGFLYEWDAKKKYDYAQFQNTQGKKYFKTGNIKEAGFRFNKGLKIICSIPIDVQSPPEIIDTLATQSLNELKAILYNNLASCFFLKEQWTLVISLCDKVLMYDENNVKAHYRAAISYMKDKDFEKADKLLKKVLEQEPNNKSALENHKLVKMKLNEDKIKVDNIARRMIGGILK